MKKIFLIPVLVLGLFACGGESNTTEDKTPEEEVEEVKEPDYEALAKDACDCVNSSTDQLSPAIMKVIVDSGGDESKLEELMTVFAEEDPIQAMQDVQLMQGSMVQEITSCMDGLESKYADVYSLESEADIQEKLLAELKNMDGCTSSFVFMKMGMAN